MSFKFHCPLCSSDSLKFYATVKTKILRDFYQCGECCLIFCNPEHLLSKTEEKARYEHHENHVRDDGYENFLKQLLSPILERQDKNSIGLDFGCGPFPMMALLAEELGYSCESYDPIFREKSELLKREYDYILCSEVAEHFHLPGKEFGKMFNLLKPKGLLGVMTSLFSETPEIFKDWYYVKDDTHVSIYCNITFIWIAKKFGFEIVYANNNVILFQKK